MSKQLIEIESNLGPVLVHLEDIATVESPTNMGGLGGGGMGKYRVRVHLAIVGHFDVTHQEYNKIGKQFDNNNIPSIEIPGENRKTIVNITHIMRVIRSTKSTTVVIGVKEQPINPNAEILVSNGMTILAVGGQEHDMYTVLQGVMTDANQDEKETILSEASRRH